MRVAGLPWLRRVGRGGACGVRGPGSAGRPRCPGVDRAPAVVHRPDGDLGCVVRRQHRTGDRSATPAVTRRDRADPRDRLGVPGRGLAARLPRRARRRDRLGLPDDRHPAVAASAVQRRLARALASAARSAGAAVPVRVAHDPGGDLGALDDRHRRDRRANAGGVRLARFVPARDGGLSRPPSGAEAPHPGTVEARAAGHRRPRPDRLLRRDGRLVRAMAARRADPGARSRPRHVLRDAGPRLAHGRRVPARDRANARAARERRRPPW